MDPLSTRDLFVKYLHTIDVWFDITRENAAKRSFDADVLVHARLAPDQWALAAQVQAACDNATYSIANMAGLVAPEPPDVEQTLDELNVRLASARAYLATFTAPSFAGWQYRRISHRWMEGKWIRGTDYLLTYAIPNFFFNIMTAYSILRHNGVPLGKMDYLSPIAYG